MTCAAAASAKGETTSKTLQGKRPTSGAGLIAVCREACLGGSPPAAATPEQQQPVPPKVTPVPAKDGVAADPSKGVLI